LGNKFYKEFKPILIACGVEEDGLAVHAVRHLFGAVLKGRKVTEEQRADLLGHRGKTETSERYCTAYEIKTLYALIRKMTVITAHLTAHKINFIPWVEAKQVAPFSHPSRSKKH
jgi:hypothetical protein